MRIVLIAIAGTPLAAHSQDLAAARRLAATVHLAAEEYRLGVKDGRVQVPSEVEETKLFLAEARRNAAHLTPTAAAHARAALDTLDTMVVRIADPDSVSRRATAMVEALAVELQAPLDEVPAQPPSLSRGREVYQTTCASCHGPAGRGDGPQAPGLTPRPADLGNAGAMLGSSPLDFYRRITIGSAGTAMVPYERALSADDRWAVALYASTLRLPPPSGSVPTALRSFALSARMSDSEILVALGPGATIAKLSAVRAAAEQNAGRGEMAAVFNEVRRQLDSAYQLARAGRSDEARAMAMDAYVAFEQVERALTVKDPALTARIEAAFSSLRSRAGSGATVDQLVEIRQELARALERAERTIVDRPSTSNLVAQSFVILVREGLEAILVIGALMAFLVRTGNGHRRRDIHLGVAAAILLSLLTAVALETVFALSHAHQEGLEGAVMIVAAATLFYVSYWLLSKIEVAKWNRFVRGKMENALTRGSALALASVAFLAVYREGFETVLFYKALAVSGGPGDWAPIGAGLLAGGAVLAVIYVAINRFGVRLPLKPLFAVTGALLYYMAFVFGGKGIAELQDSGAVSLTPVAWVPRIPVMGIYPTVESLALQATLLLLALVGLVWIFLVTPRQANASSGLIAPRKESEADDPTVSPREKELIRSIDRIEADLAEVRAELERMRDRVTPEDRESRKRS